MIPDPLKEWFADASKQKELHTLLSSPIFKEAVALLTHISLPKPDFTTKSSAENITDSAMEYRRCTGFFSFPDHLWQLTEMPKLPPKTPEGYSESYVKDWARRKGHVDELEQIEQQPT